MKTKIIIGITVVAFVCVAVFTVLFQTSNVTASAPSGLAATVATTSIAAVTNSSSYLFATTTFGNCATRVITTYASPVMLTFSDYSGQNPSGTFGHLQAASTTATYDGGQFGCNAVKVFSFTAQTITVTETR